LLVSEGERYIEEEEEEFDIEEEEEERPNKTCAQRTWVLLESWDRTELLDSEIDAEVLSIANERMEISGMVEWPAARCATKTIGLWSHHHKYFRDAGKTEMEAFYCPLKDRCKCPVEIRVSRNVTRVTLETCGGEHMQAICDPTDKSKKLNYQQRIAVAKVVKVNPAATCSDVRVALQRLSPSGKVQPGLARSVKSVVKIQKKKSFGALAGGVVVTNSFASIAALSERLWFGDIISKHNLG
jgi:hypothetical protein